jgi:diguanylate cyclase (GGDEF)-like protein
LLDQQYAAFMPIQVSSMVALLALRYYHERSFRTLFLLRGSLHEMASTDALTGLFNRRAFETLGRRALAQSTREAHLCLLMLIDVDHFKRYNDQHGHPAGDRALQAIATRLARFPRRPLDIAARLGGEEFVLFFADVDRDFARRVGDEVRAAVQALGIAREQAGDVLTVSVGVALAVPGCAPDELYQRADQAMYRAKREGRNRVCVEV